MATTAVGFARANLLVGLPVFILAVGGSPAFAALLVSTAALGTALGAALSNVLAAVMRREDRFQIGLIAIAAGNLLVFVSWREEIAAVGALLGGAGEGMFWVGSQRLLASRCTGPRSAAGFVNHYALYTGGTLFGSIGMSVSVVIAGFVGLDTALSLRVSLLPGLAAVLVGLVAWSSCSAQSTGRLHGRGDRGRRDGFRVLRSGLTVQVPELFLVSAAALLLPLAPVILSEDYKISPFGIGIAVAALTCAKITGAYVVQIALRALGLRATVVATLGAAAVISACLNMATARAEAFILGLLLLSLLANGVWPLVVDASLARTDHEDRASIIVAWNIRDYSLMAGVTALGSLILSLTGSPLLITLLGSALLLASALTGNSLVRRSTCAPARGLAGIG